MLEILQPGVGPHGDGPYLPADPRHVFWGVLPCEADRPVLSIDSGDEVTIDTLSHEGLLDDQGSDPAAFFASHGVPREQVLDEVGPPQRVGAVGDAVLGDHVRGKARPGIVRVPCIERSERCV